MPTAGTPQPRWPWWILESILLVLLLFLVHRHLDIPGTRTPDLGWPDRLFYEADARALAAGESPGITLNGDRLPPKFPPGIGLLLAPWYLAGGTAPGGSLVVIQLLSYLLLAGLWATVRRLACRQQEGDRPPGAGLVALAAVAGVVAGGCFTFYRSYVSTLVPDALVLLGLGALLAAPSPGRLRLAAAGAVVGVGGWLHYPLLVAALPLLLLLEPRRPGRAGRMAWTALGAAPPLLGLAAWQWIHHGAPLATGYAFWMPLFHQGGAPTFALEYGFQGPRDGMPMGPNLLHYAGLLVGRGATLHPWTVAGAAGLGAASLLLPAPDPARRARRRLVTWALATTLAYWLLFGFYYYQGPRLLAPVTPLLAAAGALGTVELAGAAVRNRRRRRAAGLLAAGVLLAANLAHFPRDSRPGLARLDGHTRFAAKIRELTPPEAVVVSDMDLLFLAGAVPERHLLPLKANQLWAFQLLYRDWRRLAAGRDDLATFGAWYDSMGGRQLEPPLARAALAPPARQVLGRLRGWIAGGRPVYLASFNALEREPLRRAFAFRSLLGDRPPFLWRLENPR